MLTIDNIRYILEDIILINCRDKISCASFSLEIDHNSLSIKRTDSIYFEEIFDFSLPSLSNHDFGVLRKIATEVKLGNQIELGNNINYLKLIHFFVNEFYVNGKLDKHGRIVLESIDPNYIPYLEFPIVDILITNFYAVFQVEADIEKKICFSCDYDILDIWKITPGLSILKHFALLLYRFRIHNLYVDLRSFLLGRFRYRCNSMLNDKMFYYDSIMGYQVENNAFWLIDYSNQQYDINNNLNSKPFRRFVKYLRKRKVKFGLHPGYDTVTKHTLKSQAEKFEVLFKEIPAFLRFHYLHFNRFKDLNVLNDTSFQADHSVYFADSLLFRCGTTLFFKMWDFNSGKPTQIRFLPITIMEGTFTDYIKSDFEASEKMAFSKIDHCMNYGFNISLLWHNRSMHPYSKPDNYLHLLFYSVLDYILVKTNSNVRNSN